MKNAIKFFAIIILAFTSVSCKTVDLEISELEVHTKEVNGVKTPSKLESQIKGDLREALIESEAQVVDIKETVVYVEKPVYVPVDESGSTRSKAKVGLDAVKQSLNTALKEPEKYRGSHHIYDYDDTFIYQIYCAPYRITDLQFEVGELIIEQPFCSEPEVWEIGGGVSKYRGVDVQHLFLKPSYTKLTSSLIVITNKRVYHFLIKSYAESWMGVVKFNYPVRIPYNLNTTIGSIAENSESAKVETVMEGVSPEFLSFDYKMSYLPHKAKRMYWLPKRVYDDGRKTYVVLPEEVLNKKLPGLFDQKNNVINYRVSNNILIVDHLIDKISLILGKDKITIEKKEGK